MIIDLEIGGFEIIKDVVKPVRGDLDFKICFNGKGLDGSFSVSANKIYDGENWVALDSIEGRRLKREKELK